MTFMTTDQATILSNVANLDIEMYKPRLAQLVCRINRSGL